MKWDPPCDQFNSSAHPQGCNSAATLFPATKLGHRHDHHLYLIINCNWFPSPRLHYSFFISSSDYWHQEGESRKSFTHYWCFPFPSSTQGQIPPGILDYEPQSWVNSHCAASYIVLSLLLLSRPQPKNMDKMLFWVSVFTIFLDVFAQTGRKLRDNQGAWNEKRG